MWVDESPGARNSRDSGHSLPAFLSLVHFWLNLFDKYFLKYLPGTVQNVGILEMDMVPDILDLIKPVGEIV